MCIVLKREGKIHSKKGGGPLSPNQTRPMDIYTHCLLVWLYFRDFPLSDREEDWLLARMQDEDRNKPSSITLANIFTDVVVKEPQSE